MKEIAKTIRNGDQDIDLQKMFVEHCIDKIPENSKKKVFYIMKGDGIWQVRKNRIGTFYIHQAELKIPGLKSDLEEGWELDVPFVPPQLLRKALSFFRAVYKEHKSEAHVQFFYDTTTEEYILHCPKQKVTGGSVSYINDKEFEAFDKILVLEMHSHGMMPAFFSGTDNGDEKDDRFFGVIGKVEQYHPEIKLRLSMGGHKIEVDVDDIFDVESEEEESFPKEWLHNVKKKEIKTINVSKISNFRFDDKQLPFNSFDSRFDFLNQTHIEMEKFKSGDYLYPTDAFVPDEGEYYIQEGDKKWFVQGGEKIFYIDELGESHLADDEDEDDEDDFKLNWRSKRF